MMLSFDAEDGSTLRSSLENLSDGTRPAGPFFLTGEASWASTPPGTHTPPSAPLDPADVSAESAFTAGADAPDELRTTVDRQTLAVRFARPPSDDVVPFITPDDPTLTPGQRTALVVEIINRGNAPAPAVRACLRLDERLDPESGLCQRIRRLAPGHSVARRVQYRVKRDACGGRVTMTARGRHTPTARAAVRILAGVCGNAPCPSAARLSLRPASPLARLTC
jgi:hypothetical protein